MDPLSIATGVGGLIELCFQAGFAIQAARKGARTVGSKISLLESEIRGYTDVLQLMSSTLQDPSITASFQSTGHIGNHWKSILALIEDSSATVERLANVLREVDRPAGIMGSARKHFRLLFATGEIEAYQKTIRTYRDTMQMSLQTIILWNQVSGRPSSDSVAPSLDELTQLIRSIATDLKSQMSGVRSLVQEIPVKDRIRTLDTMKSCVQTAGDVVSSASTTLGLDDRASVVAPSDFGDIFGPGNHDNVLRWIDDSQNEVDYLSPSNNGPGKYVPSISALSINDPESDDDDLELELELVKTHVKRGRDLAEKGSWPEAARVLERGYARFCKHETRLDDDPATGLREEIRTAMFKVYYKQQSWEKVRDLELENLGLCEQRVAGDDSNSDQEVAERNSMCMLDCMLHLAETYLMLEDPENSKKYARKCIKGYKRLGEFATPRLLDSFWAMASACRANNEPMEEQVYSLMYDELKATWESAEEARTRGRAPVRVNTGVQEAVTSSLTTGSFGDLVNYMLH